MGRCKVMCWSCIDGDHINCDRRRGVKYPDPRNPGRDKPLPCDCVRHGKVNA